METPTSLQLESTNCHKILVLAQWRRMQSESSDDSTLPLHRDYHLYLFLIIHLFLIKLYLFIIVFSKFYFVHAFYYQKLWNIRRRVSNDIIEGIHLFAKDANIGEATRSPTMNADDKTPSWKLLKLKSPLQATIIS